MSDKEQEELQTELEAAEEMIEEIVEEEAEEVGNEIDKLQAEVVALNDKYARVHADFDNIKIHKLQPRNAHCCQLHGYLPADGTNTYYGGLASSKAVSWYNILLAAVTLPDETRG